MIYLTIVDRIYVNGLAAVHTSAELQKPKIQLVLIKPVTIIKSLKFVIAFRIEIFVVFYASVQFLQHLHTRADGFFRPLLKSSFNINTFGFITDNVAYLFDHSERVPDRLFDDGRTMQILNIVYTEFFNIFFFRIQQLSESELFIVANLIEIFVSFIQCFEYGFSVCTAHSAYYLFRKRAPPSIVQSRQSSYLILSIDALTFQSVYSRFFVLKYAENTHSFFINVNFFFIKIITEHASEIAKR